MDTINANITSASHQHPLTIAIDCRMLEASGAGVYLRGCLPFFLESGNKLLLLGNAGRLEHLKSNANVSVIECDIEPFSIKELFFFPRKIARQINGTDLYYSPFFNIPGGIKIPVYSTIHDIIFPDMPELTSRLGLTIRMFLYNRCFKRSKKIFTVSQFSKSRIEYYSKGKKPVIVTYSAIQPQFLNYRTATRGKIQKKETIVFIGNIKKHKGLDCLFEAFALARKEGLPYSLIIIGKREIFRSADKVVLQKIESASHEAISFVGFVSDEQLMEHLAEASLLVQPSLYEGFCLPPLEALVLGTNVLVSDIPVLKEIYSGFPVRFFTAGDTHDLKSKIMEALSGTKSLSLPENLIDKYTFEKTASIILQSISP